MVSGKFIIIPIEIKVRDFLSRLKLSIELCDKGFNVVLGSQDSIRSHLSKLPRGIFFEKAISKEKLKFFRNLKNDNYILVSLDEEGLCSLFNYERYITQRVSAETLSLADKVFTWGESEAELIKHRYSQYKDKIKVTGNPRMDMLLEPNKLFHQDLADKYEAKFGPYFLFPSSFTVNHAMGNENFDNFLIKMGRIEKSEDLKAYHEKQDFFKRTFIKYSKLLEKVAMKFNNVNIIIRPHPAEDPDHWNNLAKKYQNVILQSKGDIASWIVGSKAVIHSSCTTGMEAFILDKPVLSFLPYTDHEYSTQISNKVSKISKDEDGILSSLQEILDGKELSNYSKKDCYEYLKKHIENLKGSSSWDLISSEFESFDVPEETLGPVYLNYRTRLKRQFITIKQRIFNPKSITYEKQKFDGISLEEITEKISRLSKISNKNTLIKVDHLSDNLFHIYS
jgi:surface carbohydrate biosynthesis protein